MRRPPLYAPPPSRIGVRDADPPDRAFSPRALWCRQERHRGCGLDIELARPAMARVNGGRDDAGSLAIADPGRGDYIRLPGAMSVADPNRRVRRAFARAASSYDAVSRVYDEVGRRLLSPPGPHCRRARPRARRRMRHRHRHRPARRALPPVAGLRGGLRAADARGREGEGAAPLLAAAPRVRSRGTPAGGRRSSGPRARQSAPSLVFRDWKRPCGSSRACSRPEGCSCSRRWAPTP